MNIFSRIKGGIPGLLAAKQSRIQAAKMDAPAYGEPVKAHLIRFRKSAGRPIFGPAFNVPREGHHLSRQLCRHYLRTRMFGSVSAGNPLMSRRERRRFARLFACLEYRRMVQDPTNALDAKEEALYRHLPVRERAA